MDYIDKHRTKMVVGGALLDDSGATRVGMVLAIDLPDRKAVEEFLADEPYNRAGIFECVVIRKFHRDDPKIFDGLIAAERVRVGSL